MIEIHDCFGKKRKSLSRRQPVFVIHLTMSTQCKKLFCGLRRQRKWKLFALTLFLQARDEKELNFLYLLSICTDCLRIISLDSLMIHLVAKYVKMLGTCYHFYRQVVSRYIIRKSRQVKGLKNNYHMGPIVTCKLDCHYHSIVYIPN